MRTTATLVAALALLAAPHASHAHLVAFQATLDTAQEVPAPNAPDDAGGTAYFVLDEEGGVLDYSLSVRNLTGAPLAAHIHAGAPGVPGPVVITLDPLPVVAVGSVHGVANLQPDVVDQLLDLAANPLYVNVHTGANPAGEIRGQLTEGGCNCDLIGWKGFKECVREAFKALPKDQKKAAKAAKAFANKAACGKTKGKKKAVRCCAAASSDPANLIGGKICALVPPKQCTKLGGVAEEPASCETACSPSGAFLELTAD